MMFHILSTFKKENTFCDCLFEKAADKVDYVIRWFISLMNQDLRLRRNFAREMSSRGNDFQLML